MTKKFEGDLDRLFKIHEPTISEKHLTETVTLTKKAYGQKRSHHTMSSLSFIKRQFPFLAKSIWLVQALVLSLLLIINAVMFDLRYYTTRVDIAEQILSLSAIITATTILPSLYRSRAWGMEEVEKVTMAAPGTLLLARLMLVGLGDFFALALIGCQIYLRTGYFAFSMVLSTLLPYFSICFLLLFIHNQVRREWQIVLSSLVTLGMILLMVWSPDLSRYFGKTQIYVGLVLLSLVVFLGLIHQCKSLFSQGGWLEGPDDKNSRKIWRQDGA